MKMKKKYIRRIRLTIVITVPIVVIFSLMMLCNAISKKLIEVHTLEQSAIENEVIEEVMEEILVEEKDFEQEDVIEQEDIVEEVVLEKAFNPNNVLEVSNVTEEDLYKLLEGTGLYDLAPIYVEAEREYGVNALFIASLTAQESAWGRSHRAIYDNNLTGFGVYNAHSEGINSNSKRENILSTTKWLKEAYLNPTGKHYNGTSVWQINMQYCLLANGKPDYQWAENIVSIGYSFLRKL